MSTTATTLIEAAYRKIGENSPNTDDKNDAFENLNNMLSSWGVELLNYYEVRDEALTVSSGTASYTIGSGGTFDTARPVKIESAFIRDSSGYDWPLGIITASEYDEIKLKSWDGRPEKIYYVTEYPLGKIIFDCEPSESYTLYLTSQKNFTEFAGLTTVYALPPEYKEAIIYNLAITLAEDRGKSVADYIIKKAKDLKESLLLARMINRPAREVKFEISSTCRFNITTGE